MTTYAWDARGRLTGAAVHAADGTLIKAASFVYDALNQRVRTVVTDGTGSVVSDERYANTPHGGAAPDAPTAGIGSQAALDDLALVLDASGNVVDRVLYGPGVDEAVAEEDGSGQVSWLVSDPQRTVRAVLHFDAATSVTSVAKAVGYDAFGNVASDSAPGVGERFGYDGRTTDGVSGLQFGRAREYDPGTGTWASPDPEGFGAGDPNEYRYVGNSPANGTDPSGLWVVGPVEDVYKFEKWIKNLIGLPTGLNAVNSDSTVSEVKLTGWRFTTLGVVTFDPKYKDLIQQKLAAMPQFGEEGARQMVLALYGPNQTRYVTATGGGFEISDGKGDLTAYDTRNAAQTDAVDKLNEAKERLAAEKYADWVRNGRPGGVPPLEARSPRPGPPMSSATIGPHLTPEGEQIREWTDQAMSGHGGTLMFKSGGLMDTTALLLAGWKGAPLPGPVPVERVTSLRGGSTLVPERLHDIPPPWTLQSRSAVSGLNLSQGTIDALKATGMNDGALDHYLHVLGDAYVFRGTTEGFPGNPVLERLGLSPTSVDPLVATVFAAEGASKGKNPMVLFGRHNDFGGVLDEGNVRKVLEREVAVPLTPTQFAKTAPYSISLEEARAILKQLGYDVPATFASPADATTFLNTNKRMTPEQIKMFIDLATRGR